MPDLDPDDIESVEVIKGDAAARLYGDRGANGVIQITTKEGGPS
jgi:TonB-dependent SusC/RagA subfamily outer membrane receptor